MIEIFETLKILEILIATTKEMTFLQKRSKIQLLLKHPNLMLSAFTTEERII